MKLTLLLLPSECSGRHVHVEAVDDAALFDVEGFEHFNVDIIARQLFDHLVWIATARKEGII